LFAVCFTSFNLIDTCVIQNPYFYTSASDRVLFWRITALRLPLGYALTYSF